MPGRKEPSWEALELAASERSPLFLWMLRHHDRLMSLPTGRRMNWRGLSRELAAEGLTDRDGNPPSAETARKTWQRVRRFVAERRTQEAAASSTSRAPELKPKPGDEPPEDEASGEKPRRRFELLKP